MTITRTAQCETCGREIRGRERDGRVAWDHATYADRLIGGEHFPTPRAETVRTV